MCAHEHVLIIVNLTNDMVTIPLYADSCFKGHDDNIFHQVCHT